MGPIVSGEVLPRRRFGVETRRAPSLLLVAPPLGFPRYRAPEGALKKTRRTKRAGTKWQTFHGYGTPCGARNGDSGKRQGANQRAAIAVSGIAAERPMEPKGFAPLFASLRLSIFPGHDWGGATHLSASFHNTFDFPESERFFIKESG